MFMLKNNTYFVLVIGRRSKNVPRVVGTLYPSPLEIATLKLRNLIELCDKHVIPQRFWDEYKMFVGMPDVPDVLPETDEEDEKHEED